MGATQDQNGIWSQHSAMIAKLSSASGQFGSIAPASACHSFILGSTIAVIRWSESCAAFASAKGEGSDDAQGSDGSQGILQLVSIFAQIPFDKLRSAGEN